jgi:uncharacterized membrane protein
MKKLWNLIMKGLAALLPIGLTVYVVYWLGTSAEAVMRGLLQLFIPEQYYRPGLGVVTGIAILIAVGMLVNAYLVRWALEAWENFLARIPLVKTVYGAIRDLVKFLPGDGKRRDLKSVVLVSFGDAQAIGFVTREATPELDALTGSVGRVAVYFPMSYQIGGYTLYLPRERLTSLDLSVEEAMRLVLTGGVSTVGEK